MEKERSRPTAFSSPAGVHHVTAAAVLKQIIRGREGKTNLDDDFVMALTEAHERSIKCIYRRINHFKFILGANRVIPKAYPYYCF